MEGDECGLQVRRTSRARKVNPRFVNDDIDENYMKMVGRITASNYSNKDSEAKEDSTDGKGSGLYESQMIEANKNVDPHCQNFLTLLPSNKSGISSPSINIALKTVSFKRIKKGKKNDSDVNSKDLKLATSSTTPSIIVQCRSSTESEISEEFGENETEMKRKADVSSGNFIKKLKRHRLDGKANDCNINSESSALPCNDEDVQPFNDETSSCSLNKSENKSTSSLTNVNIKNDLSARDRNLLQRAFVPLSISSKIEQYQPKIVLSSKSKFNLPDGKQLKIVSLKPITTIKENSTPDLRSNSNLDRIGSHIELKIVKKESYPLSGSNLPPVISNGANKALDLKENVSKSNDGPSNSSVAPTNLFTSDGEDDIPLNKLIEKQGVAKKKKKIMSKELKIQKPKFKKNCKTVTNRGATNKKPKDQDDLPLKVLIKKSKTFTKAFSDKVKSTIRKTQNLSSNAPTKKLKLKKGPTFENEKSKPPPSKKKKTKLIKAETSKNNVELALKVKENKIKKLSKIKSQNFDSKFLPFKNKAGPSRLLNNKRKIKANMPLNKFRFKFPKRNNIERDTPLASETTNIVVSVSGIEGDYACLAIDKDQIHAQSDQAKISKKPQSKNKNIKNKEDVQSKIYTFNSGLVLEEDVPSEKKKFKSIEPETKVKCETSDLRIHKDLVIETVKSKDSKTSKKSKDGVEIRKNSYRDDVLVPLLNKSKDKERQENIHKEDRKTNIKASYDCVKKLTPVKKSIAESNNFNLSTIKDDNEENHMKPRISDTADTSEQKKNKEKVKEEKGKQVDGQGDSEKGKLKVKSEIESKKPKHHKSDGKKRHSLESSCSPIKLEENVIKKERSEIKGNVISKKNSKDPKHDSAFERNDENSKKVGKEIEDSNSKKWERDSNNIEISMNNVDLDSDDKNNLSPKKFDNESSLNDLTPSKKLEVKGNSKRPIRPDKENSPVTNLASKVKKKENFEEALLSFPLPKLSKQRSSDGLKSLERKKDDKKKNNTDKKTPYKDVKQEANEKSNRERDYGREISMVKDSSSPFKMDAFKIKSESSKSIKKEEKNRQKEERRRSSSSSSKTEKRKSDHEIKEEIKINFESNQNDEKERKRKREEKEKSRHSSHKKHKRDRSETRRQRSHSGSNERKYSENLRLGQKKEDKERYEKKVTYDSKNKDRMGLVIKNEDKKDLIINRIIDGIGEHSPALKQEQADAIDADNSKAKEHSKVGISNSDFTNFAKQETKSEVIVDEEYLINTNNAPLKGETDFIQTNTLSNVEKLSNSLAQIKKEFPQSTLKVSDPNPNIVKLESKSVIEEVQEANLVSSVKVDKPEFSSNCDNAQAEFDSNCFDMVIGNPLSISETMKNYHISKEKESSSDLGILEEMRNLKEQDFNLEQRETKIKLCNDELNNSIIKDSECTSKSQSGGSDKIELKSSTESALVDAAVPSICQIDAKINVNETELQTGKPSEPLEASLLKDVSKTESGNALLNSASEKLSLPDFNNKHASDKVDAKVACVQESMQDSVCRTPQELISQKKEEHTTLKSSSSSLASCPIPLPNKADSESDFGVLKNLKKLSPHPTSLVSSSSSPVFPAERVADNFKESLNVKEIATAEKENISPDRDFNEPLSEKPPCSMMSEEPKAIKELTPEEIKEKERINKQIVEERMKLFETLDENLYLLERVKNKRSKEAKRMVCDCSLTKEEISNDEMGCGEDCLNRLLMIECGARCNLKERCMNRKFQQKSYSPVEVFNAEEKGCGVRSMERIEQGTFIMEYIGEVFDTREFKRRRKEYAKESNAHFYFMALRSDRLIDATRKGNISRFINHSCSPNAETQKWTVNGDIRIGFFATRDIELGEEINFDYRLERYGREPQRCYCGTPECRGWLGEPPDQKTKEEKEEDRKRMLKDKQRREGFKKSFYFEDMDLEDEIEKLTSRGLRNRQDTLNLSRLMVRCEDSESRSQLLKILETSEEASKRLFLDYHGLKLLWSWMVDISSSHKCIPLKLEILETLGSLPITNKTQVTDSKIMNIVERWSKMESKAEKELPGIATLKESTEKKLSDGSEDSDTETSEVKDGDPSPSDSVSPDDSSQDSNEVVVDLSQTAATGDGEATGATKENVGTDSISSTPVAVAVQEESSKTCEIATVSELSSKLLSVWSDLKEAFKIPKKQRIEMMKEHEREVDKAYAKSLNKKKDSNGDRTQAFYDRWRYTGERERDRQRTREKWRSWRKDFEDDDKGLSKEERRERFAKQVAKEDEEARQRKLQEEMWNLHLERCTLLGHDPYFTPIFDPSGQYYWDPDARSWQSYIGPSGNLPVPASYGVGQTESAENVCPNMSPSTMLMPGAFYPLPHTPVSEGEDHLRGHRKEDASSTSLDLASIPLPGETPLPADSPTSEVPAIPISLSDDDDDMDEDTMSGIETPPMAPPGPITIKLPAKWKMARDGKRRIYFYHTKTRHTQWDIPTDGLHSQLMSRYGLTSDSESDFESDSDTTSSSDSEDFSSDEDENEEEETTVIPAVKKTEGGEVEKMIRRPKGKKVRSEKLVQERVISPILFEDREAARRERKEAKERAREEARKERWSLIKTLKAGGSSGSSSSSSSKNNDHDGEDPNLASEDTCSSLSPNDNDEDDHLEEQLLKFSRKQKSETKGHTKAKSKERAATAMADSSDLARKIKDNFRARMATYIVSVLNPYRKMDCKEGRITSNEDFKYLARKLTHFVMVKELKQLPSIDGLDCSESVKHKTKEFVRKYMSKYGNTFKRDPNDTKEY